MVCVTACLGSCTRLRSWVFENCISRGNSHRITPEMPFPLVANGVFAKHACQTRTPVTSSPKKSTLSPFFEMLEGLERSQHTGSPVEVFVGPGFERQAGFPLALSACLSLACLSSWVSCHATSDRAQTSRSDPCRVSSYHLCCCNNTA